MDDRDLRPPLTGRAEAIRDAARELLEREGPEGLSMRPLASRIGAHPPAVYRHFPDKRAVERAIVDQALDELGAKLDAAAQGDRALDDVCQAYRAWAGEHPHLFRLMFGPADVGDLERTDAALLSLTDGDRAAAHAVWACAHGLVILELDGLLEAGPDLDAAWEFTLDALRRQIPLSDRESKLDWSL
jgi:AcrR family transcriptional regulator